MGGVIINHLTFKQKLKIGQSIVTGTLFENKKILIADGSNSLNVDDVISVMKEYCPNKIDYIKDTDKITFENGSTIQILNIEEAKRGKRAEKIEWYEPTD